MLHVPGYYEYCCRVKVVAGHDVLERIPAILGRVHATRPMIVTDRGVAGALRFDGPPTASAPSMALLIPPAVQFIRERRKAAGEPLLDKPFTAELGCVSPVTEGELRIFGLDPARDGKRIRARMGVVPQLDQLAANSSDYQVLGHHIEFSGICESCGDPREEKASN